MVIQIEPLSKGAAAIWRVHRQAGCRLCPLGESAHTPCLHGEGPVPARGMIVGNVAGLADDDIGRPMVGEAGEFLRQVIRDADLDIHSLYRTLAVRCAPGSRIRHTERQKVVERAQRACAPYLQTEIGIVKPTAILSMGAAAYYQFTHKSGIMANRGQVFEWNGIPVVPTLAPEQVLQLPQLYSSFESDVRKFARLLKGQSGAESGVRIVPVRTEDDVRAMMAAIDGKPGEMLTWDVETRGFVDYRPGYSRMWMVALTVGTRVNGKIEVWGLPLEHPESPFLLPEEAGWPTSWVRSGSSLLQEVIRWVTDRCLTRNRVNNHNIKFDIRHMMSLAERYGHLPERIAIPGFDTMVAAGQFNEELPMNLRDVASLELGVDNWGKGKMEFGDGKKPPTTLWGPDGMIEYGSRDVGYTHLLYEQQRPRLISRQGQARLVKEVILPGLRAYARMERNGVWVDRARMDVQRRIRSEVVAAALEQTLQYVPEVFRATANLGSGPFLRRWLYGDPPDGLGLTPTKRTEKAGEPSTDEEALAGLDHPATRFLLEWRGAAKSLQFFDQWEEWMGPDDRLHPSFNIAAGESGRAVVTGRRSCNNPNLQQVPREGTMRSIIGAPPGYLFGEVDYSAIEVRLAAWLSGDRQMLDLFRQERDPYRYVVSYLMDLRMDHHPSREEEAAVTKDARQKGKVVVLGFQYGLGARGFVEYADAMYGVKFDLEESTYLRNGFFTLFPGYAEWHARSKREVRRKHEVVSPTGRVRHLTRILSSDQFERGRAERQSINSPVQGLGGDLTLMSMVELDRVLDPGRIRPVGDIHDALLFEVREDCWREEMRRVLTVMEHPPLLDTLGISPPVRLKAEAKIGTHWGDAGLVEFSLDTIESVEFPRGS